MSVAILYSIPFLTLLGMALGVAGGLLGIGGGLIAIPILAHCYAMDQQLAQGTALVMIAPNVLIGFIRYRQKNQIALRPLAPMVICSMVATFLAARYATVLDPRVLQVGFAVFLICLAIYFGTRTQQPAQVPLAAAAAAAADACQRAAASTALARQAPVFGVRAPVRILPLVGVGSGVMSGLFTIGGGLVVVPVLVTLFRMTQTRAQGMALALVVPGALIALCTYAGGGHVNWSVGLPLAAGGVLSVSWGVTLAHRFSPARLRLVFCAVLLATSCMMLF